MASKGKLEYKAKHLEMMAETWDEDFVKIEKMCNIMQREGWMLHTMSWPDQKNAVLVFVRTDLSR